MTRSVPLALFACALAAAASSVTLPLAAQTKATATNVPVIPHEPVVGFFKNPPGIYTGENMGIATNSKGQMYIYHRANETRLFEYTPQGQFVREIGRGNYGFAFAHSVRVDAQDNIWAVDEGTDMLVKFSPEGKVLMTIGRRQDPVESLGNMPSTTRSGRALTQDDPARRGRPGATPSPWPCEREEKRSGASGAGSDNTHAVNHPSYC